MTPRYQMVMHTTDAEVARYRRRLRDAQYDLYLCRIDDAMTDKAETNVRIALDHLWWAQGEKDAW